MIKLCCCTDKKSDLFILLNFKFVTVKWCVGRMEETRDQDGSIEVRIKHGENEILKRVRKTISLGLLKSICFPLEAEQNRPIRLIFSGFLLDNDEEDLEFYGITDGSVLHASISDTANYREGDNEANHGHHHPDIPGPGRHLPLLVGFILSCLWLFLLFHEQSGIFFDRRNTVLLALLTGILVYGWMKYG